MRRPPTRGPQATAAPTVAPQTASAAKRWALGTVTDKSERGCEEGGPLIPWSARATSRAVMLQAMPAKERGRCEEHDPGDEDEPASVPIRERAGIRIKAARPRA